MTNPVSNSAEDSPWRAGLLRLSELDRQTFTLQDLAGLGSLQTALEEVADLWRDPHPDLSAKALALTATLTDIMLGDTPDPEASLAAMVALLDSICAAQNPEEALAIFASAESLAEEDATAVGAGAAVEEDLGPPPLGAIAINGAEDSVIYKEFISESNDHLDRIEARALELESETDNIDLINDMFRCFHSMKGAAGFLGLTAVNQLCHEVETMLDRCRKRTLGVNSMVVELILNSIDMAKRLLELLDMRVEAAERGEAVDAASPLDIRPVVSAVQQLLAAPPPVAAPVTSTDLDPNKIGGALVRDGVVSAEQMQQALSQQSRPVGQILVDMGAASQDAVEGALSRSGGRKRGPDSIKVDTRRLDALLEMVGELVIAESQVAQDPALRHEGNLSLLRNVANLGKITHGLQELVMDMRLVPLRGTFQKMMRVVRDTARKTGKEVNLEISGDETEIDKTVVEEIADPLVHLLRNAVDHGVELPDDREANGKPREGTIHLMAYHEGGNVVIEIRDDGAGIKRDRVLKKAIERGLVEEGHELTDQDVYDFIFRAGFSTHDVATDISGRGVGMDVVRKNIEELGGRVEVQSKQGKGSTFLVRLPLTMAIVDGMIVQVGQERYILPTLGIDESIRPDPSQISSVTGRGKVLQVRGELVPLMNLSGLFTDGQKALEPEGTLVIIVRDDDQRCGLIVDDLLGQQQVVIKSLGQQMQGVLGISGGCILGDGCVGLILDVAGLIRLSQGERRAERKDENRTKKATGKEEADVEVDEESSALLGQED